MNLDREWPNGIVDCWNGAMPALFMVAWMYSFFKLRAHVLSAQLGLATSSGGGGASGGAGIGQQPAGLQTKNSPYAMLRRFMVFSM